MKKFLLIGMSAFLIGTSYSFADEGSIPSSVFDNLSSVIDTQKSLLSNQQSSPNNSTSTQNSNNNGTDNTNNNTANNTGANSNMTNNGVEGQDPLDPNYMKPVEFSSRVDYKRDRNSSTMTISLVGADTLSVSEQSNMISVQIPDSVMEQNGLQNVLTQEGVYDDRLISSYIYTDGEGTNNLQINLKQNVTYSISKNAYGFIISFNKKISSTPRIVIDPGHGGKDPGATSKTTKVQEKALALKTSLNLRDSLVKKGYEVIMTRDADYYPTVPDRAVLANQMDADVFISVHYNSTTKPTVYGIETWAYNTPDNNALAEALHRNIIGSTGARNRGVKDGRKLIVLNTTKVPAVLLELGFLSNPNEARLVMQEHYQKTLVQAITKGVDDYFGR